VETLEKGLKDMPKAKRTRKSSQSEEEESNDSDDERDEEQMIAELEALTKTKEVENSTLKMGYNEEDYVYSRKEYPNCFHDTIVPRGWERKEKFVKPKVQAKEYKFKLDIF
jgi:hypothetical protein